MTERPVITQTMSTNRQTLKTGTRVFARHWLAWVNLGWGIVFGLPWLAPVLMKIGARNLARALYTLYSFFCHQLADRSFFLFGEQSMYSSGHLTSQATQGNTWLALRSFAGSQTLGYKVAWSDRMVAIYGGILLGGMLFTLVRRRLAIPPWWLSVLLLVPMAMDGTSHVFSDVAGFNLGFRYTNIWLANLTQHRLADAFYIGNALGSFNSWARLISGTLAGLAVVRTAYPILEEYFAATEQTLTAQLQQVDAGQQDARKRHHPPQESP